ncbi:hypothetical protein EVAR_96214_1 [Eumeta japonica]|uniref:Uncharacterized protein n=1 Tax=Eumeta variegata TaxID=151549 RepID=A0A4C1WJM2_EUMVA|nr:hypothetical protein EVAR_96214_1 [Eumeta japonica]
MGESTVEYPRDRDRRSGRRRRSRGLVGAVALAGSAPAPAAGAGSAAGDPKDSASLTPGSVISLTPNSSCEELRMEADARKPPVSPRGAARPGAAGHICDLFTRHSRPVTPVVPVVPRNCRKSSILRCDENYNTFLQAPAHDDSSTSPSPNKLHKSPWGKMRDIIQTKRESVRKKQGRSCKNSPDVVPARRRSLSDGGDSDAPPALTLTIPSSEELGESRRDLEFNFN